MPLRLLAAALFLLVVAAGCRAPPATEPAKKDAKKSAAPSLETQRKLKALETQLAVAEAQLDPLQKREALLPAVNVHEHLLYKRHLENYLPAARAFAVEKTVLVASPQFTLFGKGAKGEPIMSENFAVLLEVAKEHPDEIVPFFTVSPEDEDFLARAKRHVAAGGKGVKLYTGHSNLHDRPLDAPELMPLYAYFEEIGLPINWHINLAKWHVEFDRVMSKHPKLNVMVPHYGVCFWRPEEHMPIVAGLMRKYPNLYVDTSLGTREILIDGLYRMAEHKPLFRAFFEEFQDRIVWGTDAVITGNVEKTPSWYAKVLAGTRDQLEREQFQFPLAEGYSRYFKKGRDPTGVVEGLALPQEILKKVYRDNALRWLDRPAQVKAAGTRK